MLEKANAPLEKQMYSYIVSKTFPKFVLIYLGGKFLITVHVIHEYTLTENLLSQVPMSCSALNIKLSKYSSLNSIVPNKTIIIG